MTTNPHCPGVPHRPDDPLYRAAVKRHAELGGTIETFEPVFGGDWFAIDRMLCKELEFNQWDNGLEYRPAEPLRTDAYPQGSPNPGDGWRLILVGERLQGGDEYWNTIRERWQLFQSPESHTLVPGFYVARRRLTPEQAKTYDETVEEMRAAGGDAWDDVTDVDAELRKIRNPEIDTDSCDRIARMESLVKRLAAMDTTTTWPWQCAVARLIEEAKELTNEVRN